MFSLFQPKPKTSLERIGASLRSVGSDINHLLESLSTEAGDRTAEVKERLAAVADRAQATGRQIEKQAVHGFDSMTDLIKRRPAESIAVAFALGMIFVALRKHD